MNEQKQSVSCDPRDHTMAFGYLSQLSSRNLSRFGAKHVNLLLQRRNLQYSSAVTRDISKSLHQYGLTLDPNSKQTFNFDLAIAQHSSMTSTLQKVGLNVSQLQSDDLPDSVFIEDTAVIIKDQILITNPGAPSRQPETIRVKEFLSANFPKHKMSVLQHGTLDGGDVLFTGSEIFVGLSARTSKRGIESLQNSFANYPVTAVDLAALQTDINEKDKVLHLKSFCSMAGDHRILVGGPVGKRFLEWLSVRDKVLCAADSLTIHSFGPPKPNILQKYSVISLPDAAAANCVFANNTIIRRATKEFPASGAVFERELGDTPQVEIEYGELAKLDGALTCCSLLL